MSGGFKDIIKAERVQALEKRQALLEQAHLQALRALLKQGKELQAAQELFFETFMTHTWRGRFKRLMRWLG